MTEMSDTEKAVLEKFREHVRSANMKRNFIKQEVKSIFYFLFYF